MPNPEERQHKKGFFFTPDRRLRRIEESDYLSFLTQDNDNHTLLEEIWLRYGERHRIDAPAVTRTDLETGVVVYEVWCENGRCHRIDGPAQTHRDRQTGAATWEAYWLDGRPTPSRRPSAPDRKGFLQTKNL